MGLIESIFGIVIRGRDETRKPHDAWGKASMFLDHSSALFEEEPRLTSITLSESTIEELRALVAIPAMKKVRELTLPSRMPTDEAMHVLASLDAPLTSLSMYGASMTIDGARALESAAFSETLEFLAVAGSTKLDVEGASVLVRSERLPRLTKLVLSGCRLGTTSMFEGAARTPSFVHLGLSDCFLASDAGAHLATLPFDSLRSLDLTNNALGFEGLTALAKGTFPALEDLVVTDNHASHPTELETWYDQGEPCGSGPRHLGADEVVRIFPKRYRVKA